MTEGGYNGNFRSNNLKTETISVSNAIKVARECRVANEEQVLASLFSAHRYDDA